MIPPDHKLHAIAVHYPMALLTVFLLFDGLAFVLRRAALARMALPLLWLGALGAVASFLTGERAEHSVNRTSEALSAVLEQHENLARVTMIVFLVLAALRTAGASGESLRARVPLLSRQWDRPRRWHAAFLVAAVAATALLMYVGHLGGQLVYDFGANVTKAVAE